jgi:signal peptidase I
MKGKDGNYVDYAFVEYKEKNKPNFENYSPQAVEPEKELSDLDNTKVEANRSALFLEKKRDFQHFVLEGNPGEGPYCFMRESCTRTPEGYICQIPEEYYMVMGDNRDDSSDSRFWGLVKREDILGKALIIYFSINWKDNTCNKFDSGFSDSPQGVSEEDKNKNCHPSEIGSRLDEESIFNWLDRTVRYRIWRMEVRWKRIGRILQ